MVTVLVKNMAPAPPMRYAQGHAIDMDTRWFPMAAATNPSTHTVIVCMSSICLPVFQYYRAHTLIRFLRNLIAASLEH